MNDPVKVRAWIRRVLSVAPKRPDGKSRRPLSEEVIFSHVEKLTMDKLTVDELKEAIAWNAAKGFVAGATNEETEKEDWVLTPKGFEREGL